MFINCTRKDNQLKFTPLGKKPVPGSFIISDGTYSKKLLLPGSGFIRINRRQEVFSLCRDSGNEKDFTLIEVLITLLIIGVVFTPLLVYLITVLFIPVKQVRGARP